MKEGKEGLGRARGRCFVHGRLRLTAEGGFGLG